MSETLTHKPQALEDVKAGDLVTVFKSQGLGRPSTVKRVTKHQIILDNGDHYYRRNGRNDRAEATLRKLGEWKE